MACHPHAELCSCLHQCRAKRGCHIACDIDFESKLSDKAQPQHMRFMPAKIDDSSTGKWQRLVGKILITKRRETLSGLRAHNPKGSIVLGYVPQLDMFVAAPTA